MVVTIKDTIWYTKIRTIDISEEQHLHIVGKDKRLSLPSVMRNILAAI
jgi:hypothetical protein